MQPVEPRAEELEALRQSHARLKRELDEVREQLETRTAERNALMLRWRTRQIRAERERDELLALWREAIGVRNVLIELPEPLWERVRAVVGELRELPGAD